MSSNQDICRDILFKHGFALDEYGWFEKYVRNEGYREVEVRLSRLLPHSVAAFLGWAIEQGNATVSRYVDLSVDGLPCTQAVAKMFIVAGILPHIALELLDVSV
jgi:hypothetical protein